MFGKTMLSFGLLALIACLGCQSLSPKTEIKTDRSSTTIVHNGIFGEDSYIVRSTMSDATTSTSVEVTRTKSTIGQLGIGAIGLAAGSLLP